MNINFERIGNQLVLKNDSVQYMDIIQNYLILHRKVPKKSWDRYRKRLVHSGYRMEPVDLMQYAVMSNAIPFGWLPYIASKLKNDYDVEINVDTSSYYKDKYKSSLRDHMDELVSNMRPLVNMDDHYDWLDEFYPTLGFKERLPRYYQHNALYTVLKHKQTLIKAPTASGKTFMAYMIAKTIDRPTIMITNTKSLSAQNASDFEEYGWPKDRIFMYNSEIKKLPDKLAVENHEPYILFVVDKSLPKIKFLDKIDVMMVDECLDGKTDILTEKGDVKLKNIEIGDEVITPGGHALIKDKWVTKKMAYEYMLSDGSTIIGSKDHLFLTTESMGYTVKRGSEVTKLVKFNGEYGQLFYDKDEYFLGLFLGDGTCDKTAIKFGFRKDIDFFSNILTDIYPDIKIRKNKRGDTVFTLQYSDAINFINRWNIFSGNKCTTVEIPKELYNKNSVGVIKGLFDAEGYRTKGRIGLDMVSKTIVYQISDILHHYGIDNVVKCIDSNCKPNRSPRYRLSIYGNNINIFNRLIGFRMQRKNIANMSKYAIKQMSDLLDVVSIKEVGERELIDIELDDKDKLFIANGIVTHNCHHARSETYMKNLHRIGAYVRIGLSATPLDHKSYDDILKVQSYIGNMHYTYSVEQAHKDGYLSEIEFHVHNINKVTNFKNHNYNDMQLGNLTEFPEVREVCITENKHLYEYIKNNISDKYKKDKMVFLVDLIDQGEKLQKMIPDAVFVSGKDDIETREKFRKGMEDGQVKRIISTKIFTEGVNISSLEHIVLVGPKKGVIPVIQAVGRTMRKAVKKNRAIVHDFLHMTHGMLQNQFSKRISIYQEKTHGQIKYINGE